MEIITSLHYFFLNYYLKLELNGFLKLGFNQSIKIKVNTIFNYNFN